MIVMPQKILWPTDFSPLSLKAIDYARGFREIFDGSLHIVNVSEIPANPMVDFEVRHLSGGVDLASQLRESAQRELEKLRQRSFKDDHTVTLHALVGVPWYEICQYAQQNEIDLIIVATHGRTGLKHVVMGSVAERIVRHAPCPVLVVKNEERDFTR